MKLYSFSMSVYDISRYIISQSSPCVKTIITTWARPIRRKLFCRKNPWICLKPLSVFPQIRLFPTINFVLAIFELARRRLLPFPLIKGCHLGSEWTQQFLTMFTTSRDVIHLNRLKCYLSGGVATVFSISYIVSVGTWLSFLYDGCVATKFLIHLANVLIFPLARFWIFFCFWEGCRQVILLLYMIHCEAK